MNEKNPFIPIPPAYRQLLIIYFIVYVVIIPFVRLFTIDSNIPNQFSRQLFDIIYNFLLFLPIFFYRKQYGFLHPLLFSTLFTLATEILKAPNQLFSFLDTSSVYDPIFNTALRGWDQFKLADADLFLKFLEIISLVFYYVGFFYGPKIRNIKFKPIESPSRGFYIKCLIVIFLALGTLALYLKSKGGITAHFNEIGEGRSEIRENDGIYLVIIRLGFTAALIMYAFNKNLIKNPLFLMLLIPVFFANFASQGSRSSIIIAAAAFFILWMIHNKKVPTGPAIAFGIVAVIIVGVLGQVRRSSQGQAEVNWNILTDFTFEEATTSFYDDIDKRENDKNASLAVAARGIEDFGLLWGKTYGSFVFFWIPRAIWEGKPFTLSYYTARLLYKDDAGRLGSAVVEAYWNFHVFGVMLVFFLYGTFHRWLANFFIINSEENAENPSAKCIYVVLLLMIGSPNAMVALKAFQVLVPMVAILVWGGVLGPGIRVGTKKIL